MTRYRASGIHFFLSATVILLFFSLVWWVWYPSPYFILQGGSTVTMVLIGVDLILGPTLTLIVFNPKKRELVYDLAIIASIQLAAFIYGAWVIYSEHPAYLVYNVDRFSVVQWSNVDHSRLVHPELKRNFGSGPLVVYAQLPADPKERSRILEEVMAGKADIERRPEYYQPYAAHQARVVAKAQPLEVLIKRLPAKLPLIAAALDRLGVPLEQLKFVPVAGKFNFWIMLIDKNSGELLEPIPVDPWS